MEEMSGKICMVTGASSGLGNVTAIELSKMNATVYLVCRDERRGKKTLDEVNNAGGNEKAKLLITDLSVMKNVENLSKDFLSKEEKLHVLVNNAATVPYKRTLTNDGIEMQLAVNDLAPFLLTHRLLGALKKAAPSRIVNVSSGLHYTVKLDLNNLQGEKRYKPMNHYGMTKLFNIYFSFELAKRLEGTGVTVNVANPGFSKTGLGRDFSAGARFAMRLFGKNVTRGARTQIYLASSPEVEGITGKYFSNCKQKETSELSHDMKISKKIWELCEELTGLKDFWK